MGDTIKFENSYISQTQIGGKNNTFQNGEQKLDWEEIERYWFESIKNCDDSRKEELTDKVLKLTKKRDHNGLLKLLSSFVKETATGVLSGVASEVITRFLI